MSFLVRKNNKKNKIKSYRSKSQSLKDKKISAIEECQKLYQKYSLYPSSSLLNQISEKNLKLFFEHFSIKEMTIISRILSKFFFLQSIQISPSDPEKPEEPPTKRNFKPAFIIKEEKKKKETEKKLKREKYKIMFNKLIVALGKQISQSKKIISLSLNKIEFNEKYSEILSKSISNNNSLQNLSITNSKIDLTSYEILLESLLIQNILSFLDLSNNSFNDKYGYMIARIISRHSQRRDQVIWFYSLRNELPSSNEYKRGLMFINLNGNNLSSDSAECISSVLYSDQYIRAIYLNNNKFDNLSCKKFIYMMRKNLSILTIDLRNNPGYDEDIHHRLVIKMSKNIRYLFQQFKMKEYTEDEFEQLKEFIDISFFDINIPKNVVDYYNNTFPQTTVNNELKGENGYEKEVDNYKINLKTEFEGNNINKTKNKILLDNDDNNYYNYTSANTNFTNINSNLLEENKKLYAENMKLKKQIVELKAKKLNKNININKDNNVDLNENKINTTENILDDDYNKVQLLINELNELMCKIEEKTTAKNEKNLIIDEQLKENKEKQIKGMVNSKDITERINIDKKEEGNKNSNKKDNSRKEINNQEKANNLKKSNNKKEEEKNYIEDIKDFNKDNHKNQKKKLYQNKEKNNKNKESSDDSHFVDEEGNIHNFDDLTDEEKMIILQQQLILQKLQEEAEAKGEQFDPQDYFEYLERQAQEEEEEEMNLKKVNNKLNKSL